MKNTASLNTFVSSLALIIITVISGYLLSVRNDFNLYTYPWYFPDSFDWLVNGLSYTNVPHDYPISHRAMLLPLLTAVLYDLGQYNLIPLFGTLAYVLATLSFLFLSRRLLSPVECLISSTLFACSTGMLGQSAFLGCDVAALALLLCTTYAVLRYAQTDRSLYLIPAAFFFAIGVQLQYINIIMIPFFIFAALLREDSSQRISFSFSRISSLFFNKHLYLSLLIGLTITALFFAPRYLKHGVLYEEGVAHGSLVGLYSAGIPYYGWHILAYFSLPVAALAVLGLVTGFSMVRIRLTTLFSMLWVVNGLTFFALFYTWTDIRFLIYIAPPVFLLTAIGLRSSLRWLHNSLPRPAAYSLMATLLLATYAANSITPTNSPSPFDPGILLSPWHSLQRNQRGLASLTDQASSFYFLSHTAEAERKLFSRTESLDYAPTLLQLYKTLPKKLTSSLAENIWYFERQSPDRQYIVKNRNTLYLGSRITTSSSQATLFRAAQKAPLVLVAHQNEINFLRRQLFGFPQFVKVFAKEGPYTAGLVVAPQHMSAKDQFALEADEYPERLLDGIASDASNWAASKNGRPMEIVFKEPRELNALSIHLYSGDPDRNYSFELWLKIQNSWTRYSIANKVQRLTSIDLPRSKIQGVRLIGLHNSNQEQNPANDILHVQELTFVEKNSNLNLD